MSLAEKFQIMIPYKDEKQDLEGEWVSMGSQRVLSESANCDEGAKFNKMPVGYDATSSGDHFVKGFGGDTDISGGLEPESMIRGFRRRDMKATDDQYSGEHVDLFYGEAVDEKGNTGFSERNNYLDRI